MEDARGIPRRRRALLRSPIHEFDVAAMALVINFVPDAPKAGAPRSLLQVGSSTSRGETNSIRKRRAARIIPRRG